MNNKLDAQEHLCMNCEHANWFRTDTGRLHPTGNGKCQWKYTPQPIPAAFYWSVNTPRGPYGGAINRREPITYCQIHKAKEAADDKTV